MRVIMTRAFMILSAVAGLALASCDNSDHTIVAGEPDDPMADELANAAPVELPPSIAASETYRCKDNSLVYVDWLSDGTARVKTSQSDAGTVVTPGEGSPLSGQAGASTITYNGQSCRG